MTKVLRRAGLRNENDSNREPNHHPIIIENRRLGREYRRDYRLVFRAIAAAAVVSEARPEASRLVARLHALPGKLGFDILSYNDGE